MEEYKWMYFKQAEWRTGIQDSSEQSLIYLRVWQWRELPYQGLKWQQWDHLLEGEKT